MYSSLERSAHLCGAGHRPGNIDDAVLDLATSGCRVSHFAPNGCQ
jgi:hypothetical protein